MSWSPSSSPFTFSTRDTVPVQSVATFFLIDQRTWLITVIIINKIIAKDCLLISLVKSRLLHHLVVRSVGWLVVTMLKITKCTQKIGC